jgi:hypothetical protein
MRGNWEGRETDLDDVADEVRELLVGTDLVGVVLDLLPHLGALVVEAHVL